MFLKIFKMLRVNQWLKNLLVFIPLIIETDLINFSNLFISFSAFFLFNFAASFIYIVNDWIDRKEDSHHPEKKFRPFASGDLMGLHAISSLILIGVVIFCALALFKNLYLNTIIFIYILQSLLYTFFLKKISLLEIFIVASGYVYRILVGTIVISSLPSIWMVFTVGSASLLVVASKRKIDLFKNPKEILRRPLKNYSHDFLNILLAILSATTITSYVLFTFSNYAILKFNSELLPFSSIFVFFGVLRYVQLSFKTNVSSDPINILFKDKQLFIAVFLWMVFIFLINFYR